MEDKTQKQEVIQPHDHEHKSSLHQVTPLSKYLAMFLFITLPFVGGYIGYMFAPENVVEKKTDTERMNKDFYDMYGEEQEAVSTSEALMIQKFNCKTT